MNEYYIDKCNLTSIQCDLVNGQDGSIITIKNFNKDVAASTKLILKVPNVRNPPSMLGISSVKVTTLSGKD